MLTERRSWLLGESTPVWTIPAGFDPDREAELAAVVPDQHRPLEDLHPACVLSDGIYCFALHYDEGGVSHGVIVSAAMAHAAESHLASAAVWFKTVAPAFFPVSLADEVAAAVTEKTGSSVAELVATSGHGPDVAMRDLVGGSNVRASAIEAIRAGIEPLRDIGAVDRREFEEIDFGELVDDLLGEPAHLFSGDDGEVDTQQHDARVRVDAGAVACGIVPDTGAQHQAVLFSLRDVGTISQGRSKTIWARTRGTSTTLNVTSGRVRLTGVASGTYRKNQRARLSTKPKNQAYVRAYAYQRSSVVASGLHYK